MAPPQFCWPIKLEISLSPWLLTSTAYAWPYLFVYKTHFSRQNSVCPTKRGRFTFVDQTQYCGKKLGFVQTNWLLPNNTEFCTKRILLHKSEFCSTKLNLLTKLYMSHMALRRRRDRSTSDPSCNFSRPPHTRSPSNTMLIMILILLILLLLLLLLPLPLPLPMMIIIVIMIIKMTIMIIIILMMII